MQGERSGADDLPDGEGQAGGELQTLDGQGAGPWLLAAEFPVARGGDRVTRPIGWSG